MRRMNSGNAAKLAAFRAPLALGAAMFTAEVGNILWLKELTCRAVTKHYAASQGPCYAAE